MAAVPLTLHSIRPRWSLAWLWGLGLGLYLVAMQMVAGVHAIWLADAAWMLTSAVACWWCFQAARWVEPAARRAWQLFGCGCLSWLIGQLHWDYARVIQGIELPFPSITHVFYTGFAVFMVVAVRQLPQLKPPVRDSGRVGRVALVTLCLAVVLILGMVGPALRVDLAPLYLWGGLAHTVLVTAAFIVTLHALWTVDWNERWPALLMLVLANGLYVLSNIIYGHVLLTGSYLPTHLVNVGWLAMFGLVACAAHEQVWLARQLQAGAAPPRCVDWCWLQWVVPVVLVVIMAIVAVSSAATLTPTVVSWSVAMFILLALLLGVREAWMQRDHKALTERLWTVSERLPCEMPLQFSKAGLGAALGRVRRHRDVQRLPALPDDSEVAGIMTDPSVIALPTSDDSAQDLARELLDHLEVRAVRYQQRAACGELDITALMDDLLRYYARLEDVGLQPVRLDLSSLIEQTLQTLAADLEGRHIQVRCEHQPLMLHSRAGELPLVLVLRVLLTHVLTALRDVPNASLDVRYALEGGHVVLTIQGVGLQMNEAGEMPTAWREDPTAAPLSGAGLGWALMSRAVHRLTGTVHAIAAGHGARFVVELPDLGLVQRQTDERRSAWPMV